MVLAKVDIFDVQAGVHEALPQRQPCGSDPHVPKRTAIAKTRQKAPSVPQPARAKRLLGLPSALRALAKSGKTIALVCWALGLKKNNPMEVGTCTSDTFNGQEHTMISPSTKHIAQLRTELIEDHKLKLKNEKPETMLLLIKKNEKKAFTRMATNFGFKPTTPPVIEALAGLLSDAKYKQGDKVVTATPPACPWDAAKTYAALKDQEVNPYPGAPLPKRSLSVESTDSQSSQKSVRFAKDEAQVRIFNNELPSNAI